jgi:hypothetical protein
MPDDDNFFLGPKPGVLGTSKQVGIHFSAFLYIRENLLLLQERRCNFLETCSLDPNDRFGQTTNPALYTCPRVFHLALTQGWTQCLAVLQ